MENKENKNLIELSAEEVSKNEPMLRKYVQLLSSANEIARLTGPSDTEVLWKEHVTDCAAILPLLPYKGRLIDVGTGGGLPGLVIAVCRPKIKVVLLDSIAKKCSLLEKIISVLGITNASVVCSRSEDYAKNNSEKFDIATARAVCTAGVLCEYLTPFVPVKGVVLAYKGPRAEEEIGEVRSKWKTLGLSEPTLYNYEVCESNRIIVKWTKIAHAVKGIPRRPGMAEKFPWYKK